MEDLRIRTTGYGSIESKRARSKRTCVRCGSTDLSFSGKIFCRCRTCGKIMSRRRKINREENKTSKILDHIKMRYDDVRKLNIKVGNRNVGKVIGKTFVTFREESKGHYVRKYDGFGITEKVLLRLKDMGVQQIKIIFKRLDGREELYQTDADKWTTYGKRENLGKFEKQVFLPKDLFRLIGGDKFG